MFDTFDLLGYSYKKKLIKKKKKVKKKKRKRKKEKEEKSEKKKKKIFQLGALVPKSFQIIFKKKLH